MFCKVRVFLDQDINTVDGIEQEMGIHLGFEKAQLVLYVFLLYALLPAIIPQPFPDDGNTYGQEDPIGMAHDRIPEKRGERKAKGRNIFYHQKIPAYRSEGGAAKNTSYQKKQKKPYAPGFKETGHQKVHGQVNQAGLAQEPGHGHAQGQPERRMIHPYGKQGPACKIQDPEKKMHAIAEKETGHDAK